VQQPRDTPSKKQLELNFEAPAMATEPSSVQVNNVFHVQFEQPKSEHFGGGDKDQALIDLILQSAQKLKW